MKNTQEDMPQNKVEFPVRINRYLFLKGYCSRRKADTLIEDGQVRINGKVAVLGQKVLQNDKVELSKKIKSMPSGYKYFLFNKPVNVVSHNPQKGEQSVEDFFTDARKINLAPVGRLDKGSEGLMFITNDGRIIDRMLNPKYDHEKEYIVTVDKKIKNFFVNKMREGVKIEDYQTKPAKINQNGEKTFSITLTEGKKHQIRRMCAALGYQVKKLKRTRIMNLQIRGILPGKIRELDEAEKTKLFKLIDMA